MIVLLIFYSLLLYFIRLRFIIDHNSVVGEKKIPLSIIIPARNEVSHVKDCIQSVLDNDYPNDLIEIIVVNDHSEDETLDVLIKFNDQIVLLNAEGSGKKKAIEQGVKRAKFDNIITLDADCRVDKYWLQAWAHHIVHENPTVATGLVQINEPHSILAHYEALDTINLMAVTNFGIHFNLFVLGNGANLFFKKDFYLRSKTFEQYASGDDVFLLNQANNQGQKITFNNLFFSSVFTKEQLSFSHLLSQRKRWATKTKGYANIYLILLQFIVFCTNFAALASILWLIFCYSKALLLIFTVFILGKFIIEYYYLSSLSGSSRRSINVRVFIASFFINLFIYLYMAFYAMFPAKYQWKNRTVK